MTATSAPTARTLDVPGGCLHHEIRGAGPLVVLVGAPMDADAFAPLADLLATDHTVLTTDPRGVHRSRVDDPERDSPPELRADDLSRLIADLDAGPATVLGSSGGAVSALALVQAHPELVPTVIAHEPPLEELLEDREQLRAGTQRIVDTYLAEGSAAAWRAFMGIAGLPEDDGGTGAPDGPSERDERVIADERHFFLRELRATTGFRPDLAALRAAPTRIVVGIGEDSAGQLCDRTSRALAAALGTRPTLFPGSHVGFVEDPVRFAARLREVLSAG
ncbi:alpha/beta fold hydrolase [Modestobacter marinus]|uniref:alpha/beta fold hydrolase n=1 Tax=Modestobacter marinus TaxID=477641 RepID=UPI001C952DED|nr:alpha/beta hydrolase [Modestobacter marinus]